MTMSIPPANAADGRPVRSIIFLGNNPDHYVHAERLHRLLGSEIVVLSHRAAGRLRSRGIMSTVLDDEPDIFLDFGRRAAATAHYLDTSADVVLFFEVFILPKREASARSWRIFLGHGVSTKQFFRLGEDRYVAAREDYDFVAGLGPKNVERLSAAGFPPEQIARLGVARIDEIVSRGRDPRERLALLESVGIPVDTPVVGYLPTFWGPSTIYSLGPALLRRIPLSYTVMFRPHPATPPQLIEACLGALSLRGGPYVYAADDSGGVHLDLGDIITLSDVVIGDVSSAFLETILVGRPMIFAFDIERAHRQKVATYRDLWNVYSKSVVITGSNVDGVSALLERALKDPVPEHIVRETVEQLYFDADGSAAEHIVEFVASLPERNARELAKRPRSGSLALAKAVRGFNHGLDRSPFGRLRRRVL